MIDRPLLDRIEPLSVPTIARAGALEEILGAFRGKRVLVIGIGGGGDVVSTLPTCFDLQRIGAEVIPGGLTWKRVVHDPLGRPRPLSRFRNFFKVNELIGEAGPETVTDEGFTHIEAHVSRALNGSPVVMIDIAPGSRSVRSALADYQKLRDIDAVIGVDAGGDVLCYGDETTLESPLCDQTLLSAISGLDGALLGVFGFGADGEMSLDALRTRFQSLCSLKAFRGGLPIAAEDLPTMNRVLKEAPTEASRLPLVVANSLSAERLESLVHPLAAADPRLEDAIGVPQAIPMRDGFRTAMLSDLSATTLFFDPSLVLSSSRFGGLWDDSLSVDQAGELLAAHGITTEFTEKQRLSILPKRSN